MQWESACSEFKRVLQQRPDDTKAREHLGEALYLWGDEFAKANNAEQALLRYREAVEFLPPVAELHTKTALMLARLGRFPEAQTELEKAVALEAATASLHCLLGKIYRQESMLPKAKAEFERCEALEQTPSRNSSTEE